MWGNELPPFKEEHLVITDVTLGSGLRRARREAQKKV